MTTITEDLDVVQKALEFYQETPHYQFANDAIVAIALTPVPGDPAPN